MTHMTHRRDMQQGETAATHAPEGWAHVYCVAKPGGTRTRRREGKWVEHTNEQEEKSEKRTTKRIGSVESDDRAKETRNECHRGTNEHLKRGKENETR